MIPRTFVYMLANTLHETSSIAFGDNRSQPVANAQLPYQYILSLRLEGKSSIEAIPTIRKRFGIPNSSVGLISQYLQHIGSLLPNTRKSCRENEQFCIEFATGHLQEDCEIVKDQAYGQLDQIVQSFSPDWMHQFHHSTLFEWLKESCYSGNSQSNHILP